VLFIKGYGRAVVDDTGSFSRGWDVRFATHRQAVEWGKKTRNKARVTIIGRGKNGRKHHR
jgi:3D (Asp-Asp-Asp) domain-containing protein